MSTNRNRNRPRRPAATTGRPTAPVLHLVTSEDEFTEREVLFTIDDTEYTTLVRVSASAALRYMELSIYRSVDAAILFAMRYALGDEGVEALYSYRNLTPAQLVHVTTAVTAKFDGALTVPKARPSSD